MAPRFPVGRRSSPPARNGADPAIAPPAATGAASAIAPPAATGATAPPLTSKSKIDDNKVVDLRRRRDQLSARVAELQWDLGGLVYEMAVRDRIRVEVIVRRAAVLQEADAELGEVERILKLEETGMAGACTNCGAPHSTGASYCWQCGRPLLEQVHSDSISASHPGPR